MSFTTSIIVVVGDMFVKYASLKPEFTGWKLLFVGALLYGITAFGWFFVMRRLKLSTIGVLYGLSCVLLLTFISVFYFKERINNYEITGIFLAIISIILLGRFS